MTSIASTWLPLTFEMQDLLVIGFLALLEGILSLDNALVLAVLARDLPKTQQRKALTYGLGGAVFFRFLALFLIASLLEMNWIKFVGGGYLVLVAIKGLAEGDSESNASGPKSGQAGATQRAFWKTVALIELTDIAFAVDSILAAVALSKKLWVVFVGGLLGVVMMRFAAASFIKLLDRFPRFETTAYLLVFTIGIKVIVEGLRIPGIDFHDLRATPFWVFWSLMALFVAYGFLPERKPIRLVHVFRDGLRRPLEFLTGRSGRSRTRAALKSQAEAVEDMEKNLEK